MRSCWPATRRASFTLGGPRVLSLYQIAQVLNRVGGYDPDCLFGIPRGEAGPIPPRAGNVSMDSGKLIDTLGYHPLDPWPLDESLVPTHRDWHRERSPGECGSPRRLQEASLPQSGESPFPGERAGVRDTRQNTSTRLRRVARPVRAWVGRETTPLQGVPPLSITCLVRQNPLGNALRGVPLRRNDAEAVPYRKPRQDDPHAASRDPRLQGQPVRDRAAPRGTAAAGATATRNQASRANFAWSTRVR